MASHDNIKVYNIILIIKIIICRFHIYIHITVNYEKSKVETLLLSRKEKYSDCHQC